MENLTSSASISQRLADLNKRRIRPSNFATIILLSGLALFTDPSKLFAQAAPSCGFGEGGTGAYPLSTITSPEAAQAIASGGTSIGVNQECASLTKALTPGIGAASTWTQGNIVQGNMSIPVGAPIATFNFTSSYATGSGLGYGPVYSPGGTSGSSHTGIYMGQDATGLFILEQWNGQPPRIAHYLWAGGAESGNKYYVIANANGSASPAVEGPPTSSTNMTNCAPLPANANATTVSNTGTGTANPATSGAANGTNTGAPTGLGTASSLYGSGLAPVISNGSSGTSGISGGAISGGSGAGEKMPLEGKGN